MLRQLETVALNLLSEGWAYSVVGDTVYMSNGPEQLLLRWPERADAPMAVYRRPEKRDRTLLSPWMKGSWPSRWARALSTQIKGIQCHTKKSMTPPDTDE